MLLSLDTEFQPVSPLHRKVDVESASRLRLTLDRSFTAAFIRLHADIPVPLAWVYPADADRAPADRHRRAGMAGRAQQGYCHRPHRLAHDRLSHRRQAEHQRSWRPRGRRPAAEPPGGRAAAPDRPLYFNDDNDPVELPVSYFDSEHHSHLVKLRRRSP